MRRPGPSTRHRGGILPTPQRAPRIPIRFYVVPPLTVIAGSLTAAMPFVTDSPILPPIGLLFLIAWMLLRPGFWPAWAGLPLGLIDDLFSGQPLGSAVFLWSIVVLAIEYAESKMVWRDFWQDWLIATLSILFVILASLIVAGFASDFVGVRVILPQLILTVMAYPLVARVCAWLDMWRRE